LVEYEHLQMLVVVRSAWSIENGLLTPTMKIKRNKIEETVAPMLDAWYGAGKEIVWE
jgi:long-chain acyl-CoA synthetase